MRRAWLLVLPRLFLPPWRRAEPVPPWTSLVVGTLQLFVGATIYLEGMLGQLLGFGGWTSLLFWSKGESSTAQALAFNVSGLVGLFSFLLTPIAWVALYLLAEGLVRVIGFWVASEATGSLAAYPLVALVDWTRRRLGLARRRHQQGREEPDRIEPSRSAAAPWTLEVVSARDKRWRPEVAVQMGEEFYRLIEVRERREGGRLRVGYRLAPWPANETVRAFTVYDPPVLPMPASAPPPAAAAGAAPSSPSPTSPQPPPVIARRDEPPRRRPSS